MLLSSQLGQKMASWAKKTVYSACLGLALMGHNALGQNGQPTPVDQWEEHGVLIGQRGDGWYLIQKNPFSKYLDSYADQLHWIKKNKNADHANPNVMHDWPGLFQALRKIPYSDFTNRYEYLQKVIDQSDTLPRPVRKVFMEYAQEVSKISFGEAKSSYDNFDNQRMATQPTGPMDAAFSTSLAYTLALPLTYTATGAYNNCDAVLPTVDAPVNSTIFSIEKLLLLSAADKATLELFKSGGQEQNFRLNPQDLQALKATVNNNIPGIEFTTSGHFFGSAMCLLDLGCQTDPQKKAQLRWNILHLAQYSDRALDIVKGEWLDYHLGRHSWRDSGIGYYVLNKWKPSAELLPLTPPPMSQQ